MESFDKEQLKKEAKKLLKIKGKTRGESYLIGLYLKKKYGRRGVKKVEEVVSEIFKKPFSFPKGRPREWYPEAKDVLIILTAKYLFNWKEKDLFDLGKFHALHSFTIKILIKFFVSERRIFENASDYWDKHFDFGSLEGAEFNEKERYLVLRIKGYKLHPVMCPFYRGYFYAICSCAFKGEVSVEETKCIFKGDPYHEFIIKW